MHKLTVTNGYKFNTNLSAHINILYLGKHEINILVLTVD